MRFTLPQSPIIATVGVVKRLQRVFFPHFMSRTPLLPRSERMAPWCELPGPSDVKMVYSFSSTWMVVSRFGVLSSVLYVALPLLSLSHKLLSASHSFSLPGQPGSCVDCKCSLPAASARYYFVLAELNLVCRTSSC